MKKGTMLNRLFAIVLPEYWRRKRRKMDASVLDEKRGENKPSGYSTD
jgi:hypothetical protein